MTWIVGIDEAGYGPNLGPFVMASVAVQTDADSANLWETLAAVVRRGADKDDGRIFVDDSKVVNSGPQGLKHLEEGVLAILHGDFTSLSLDEFVGGAFGPSQAELRREPWYRGKTCIPFAAELGSVREASGWIGQAAGTAKVSFGVLRGVIVCPGAFNDIVEKWDSKGAVLGQCLIDLVRHRLETHADGEPIRFYVDKHGGRNFYAALLQEAVPDGMVMARVEGNQRSVYDAMGLGRDVRFTFEPRADLTHLATALASMAAKYVREMLMHEFNSFWQEHVPGLKPTAGYPNDAVRYFEAIRPAAQKLGIPEKMLWRKR